MQYVLKTNEEFPEVRKQYTQFIYYHYVDVYTHANHKYIHIFFFHSQREWKKQKVIRIDHIKAELLVGVINGIFNDQVLYPNGEFYDNGRKYSSQL
jgi:hypothetical protein